MLPKVQPHFSISLENFWSRTRCATFLHWKEQSFRLLTLRTYWSDRNWLRSSGELSSLVACVDWGVRRSFLTLLFLANVSVQTSYVAVEPKRRKSQASNQASSVSPLAQEPAYGASEEASSHFHTTPRGSRPSTAPSRELRRARIVITVKRTESYRKWLEENPLQAMIAGDAGDEDDEEVDESATRGEVQRR